MFTVLRKQLKDKYCGMTHNPDGWSYSAIALINNSFLHLSDYGQRRGCREIMMTSSRKKVWISESWGLLMK
jgi:hypothetical protein